MEPISYSLRDVLVRQGIANGLGATGDVRGMKGRGAASDGARSQVKADAAGGVQPHRPIGPHAGGGKRDQSGMGKSAGAEAPAVNREVGNRHRMNGGHMRNTAIRDFVVHTNHNVSTMPTRQGAIRRTPSLVCIEGGKR